MKKLFQLIAAVLVFGWASLAFGQNAVCPFGSVSVAPLQGFQQNPPLVQQNACVDVVTGILSFPSLGNVSVGGTLTAGNINGVLTVDGTKYTTIDAAMTDCPSTGCIIRAKAGTLPCPIGAITKPIILEGAGPGGFATALVTSYSSGTTLTNSSTTANCITVGGSLTTAQALNGVVIRDLAIQGNKSVVGASTGDGISFVGGDSTTQLTNSAVKNVFVHDAKGVGISIKENVFGLNIEDTQIAKNGSHGIAVTNSGTGAPSQIRLARVFDWLNTGDGLNMNGTNVHDASAIQSTFANNLNGVNVVVGSTIAAFIGSDRCDFEQNTNAGVLLSDGNGHAVRDSQFPADGVQLFGVNANFPAGASTAATQLTLDNNSFSSNLTKDVNIASAKVVVIHPQASNVYTYADASGNAGKWDAITFGGTKYTGSNGIAPAVNGAAQLGDPTLAWSSFFTFSTITTEFTAPSGASGKDICYGDSTLHGLECIDNSSEYTPVGTRAILTADWTCGTGGTVASCTAATIIGSGGGIPWTFNLPLVTNSLQLDCDGVVGQATAATSNQWNLLTATNGATNVTASYLMATAATASAYGVVTDQTSTTATFQIAPNWILGGTGTKMPFHIHAAIEGASASGTVLSVQLLAPTVGDLVTIYRGSGCWIHP